jgi:hypothetical protein
MASPISLQGNGGGRIPMDGFSYDVSRHDLTQIIEQMPADLCRQMHIAARAGDTATAQRLIREAAATYYTSAPDAPTATAAPTRCPMRQPHSRTRFGS